MKEVRIHVWCSVCYDEDDARVEATTTPPLDLPDRKPVTLDLCEQHWKALLTPFAELLSEKGTRPSSAEILDESMRRRGTPRKHSKSMSATGMAELDEHGKVVCEFCGGTFNRNAAVDHVYRMHTSLSRKPEQPAQCPDCSYPDGAPVTSLLMGSHRSTKHGFVALDQAIHTARLEATA